MIWAERKFSFDFPADLYPTILMRLRHAPMRYEAISLGLPDERLSMRYGGKWSIKEHTGHIANLDATLWNDRLSQFLSGAAELQPADMANQATFDANYNALPIEEVIALVTAMRANFVARLDTLSAGDFTRTSNHPRLKVPMRLVDMLYFIAEHDDHHLAEINKLTH